jgi:hypothetical protein
MKTKFKNEIYRLLSNSGPVPKICYCAGQYTKVISGTQYPLSKDEALKLLENKPQPELVLITINEPRLNLDTKAWEGSEPDNTRPIELKGFKLQKISVDDQKTIDILLEMQSGITIHKPLSLN